MAEFTAYYMKGTRFTDVEGMTKLDLLTVTLEVLLQSPFKKEFFLTNNAFTRMNFHMYLCSSIQ